MFNIKGVFGLIAVLVICNGIYGQDGDITINTPNCCGNFTLEWSNPCSMASCYNNAFPDRVCALYITNMCVCQDPLVFDECTGTCLPGYDWCPPSCELQVCEKNNPVKPTQDRCCLN